MGGRMSDRWSRALGFLAATGAALACVLAAPQPGLAAFGPGGKERLGIGASNVESMRAYPGGKLLLFGSYAGKGTGQITRLQANGAIDTSFGENGHVAMPLSDVAVQRDGRLLVISAVPLHATADGSDLILTKLLPSGGPDPAFGQDGTVLVDLGRRYDSAGRVAVARNGRILVSGTTATRADSRTGFLDGVSVVARLLPGGALDPTFSGDGRVVLPGEGGIADLANGPRGSILAATDDSAGLTIFRVRSGGALDRSFGSGGSVVADLATGLSSLVGEVATLPGGRLVVAGAINGPGPRGFHSKGVVVRYRADGGLDRSFGKGGVASVRFNGSFSGDGFVALPNGRVVLGGQLIYARGKHSDFAAVCFGPDGRLNPRFGDRGRARVDFGGWDMFYSMAPQMPGHVVMAGPTRREGVPGSEATGLVRLPLARHRVR